MKASHATTVADRNQSDGCAAGGYCDWCLSCCITRVLRRQTCPAALQRRSWSPSRLTVWHGAPSSLRTKQRRLAAMQAQAGHAPAPAEHAAATTTAAAMQAPIMIDGSEADGCRERWLSCCCITRVLRRYSVAAGRHAA